VPRKPRADAQRNRERLLDAAKKAFFEIGPQVSLEEIVRRSGLGIGTLYRNFSTRDALVEAVYVREVQQLSDSAQDLMASLNAGDALHQWMQLFVAYISTKKLVAPSLQVAPGGPERIYASSGEVLTSTVKALVENAQSSGDILGSVAYQDVIRAMIGFTHPSTEGDWNGSALRLIDIFMNGLRTSERT
jgi:AcrR family transcriptional regulator